MSIANHGQPKLCHDVRSGRSGSSSERVAELTPSPRPLRMVVVEYHPVDELGLRVTLDAVEIEVFGEAKSMAEAIRMLLSVNPDLVIASVPAADAPVFKHHLEAALESIRTATGETNRNTAGGSDLSALTEREREVLSLLVQRCTNKEIASKLIIELSTVKTHVRNVLRKLGVRRRIELTTLSWRPPEGAPIGICDRVLTAI